MHLVTGGAGYFGEILVSHLLKRGLQVRVLDLNPLEGDMEGKVELLQGDIRDPHIVRRACQGVTHIHHNVAQVPLAKNRHLFESVNREGTRILLENALAANVEKVVYTSSSAIYGIPKTNPVTENTAPSPAEAYGQAKLEGENLCRQFIKQGLAVSIIRPRTILGHGRLGIFQILFEWIYQGGKVPILGKGDNLYQFIHADDLADACIRAALAPGNQDFNIGTDRFGSMYDSLIGLIQHAGTASRIRPLPRVLMEKLMKISSAFGLSPLGPYHALMYGRSLYFDSHKATQELGWSPRYSNIEMLCESYDWYCQHREEILARHHTSPHRSAIKQGILKLIQYLP